MGCPHKSASQEVQALPGNTVRKVWLGEWNPVSGCNILPNARQKGGPEENLVFLHLTGFEGEGPLRWRWGGGVEQAGDLCLRLRIALNFIFKF